MIHFNICHGEAGEIGILTLEIKSNTLEPSGIFWDLNIGEERCINLNIKLESTLILSGQLLEFKHFSIKDCHMRYQVCVMFLA